MSDGRGNPATAPPIWSVLLPADWWQIPLEDPDLRQAASDGLVAHQFRGIADSERLRDMVREEVRGMAEASAAEDGRMLLISTGVADGVPLTCVLVVGITESGSRTAVDATRLAREFATGADAELGVDVDLVDLQAGGRAVRRSFRSTQRPDPRGATVTSTVVDYHIPIPDLPGSLLRMTFSTPLPEVVLPAVTTLWDAIAASLTWRAGPVGSAGRSARR